MLSASRWPWLALALSAALLIGAWIFQYGLGYAPCQMCYWQRHMHKVVIGACLFALFMNGIKTGSPRLWVCLIGLALLGSFVMAFWHVGVEYKWWEGPKTCMAAPVDVSFIDPAELLKSLGSPAKAPGCSDAAWVFLGLSMAGWNALISLVGAVLSFLSARKP